MRTIEEIRRALPVLSADPDRDTSPSEEGLTAGLHRGLRFTDEGKSPTEILRIAQAMEQGYCSVGSDNEDEWQSAFSAALYWVAEQYDWDADGNPIYREGNIWGQPVG
jgi:hypothetical protein